MFVDRLGLRIELNEEDSDILFKMMTNEEGVKNKIILNSDYSISMSDEFDLKEASYGERLIYDLINWDETVYIKLGDMNFIDNRVITLTDYEVQLLTESQYGTATKEYTTPWIRMSHELIHARNEKNDIAVKI